MYRYRAEVDRVVDGDTVDLRIDLGFRMVTVQRVRLSGIDAPEKRGATREQGKAATAHLAVLLGAADVLTVATEKTGKFGRWLAEIFADGRSVNQQMIDDGFAVIYHGGKRGGAPS